MICENVSSTVLEIPPENAESICLENGVDNSVVSVLFLSVDTVTGVTLATESKDEESVEIETDGFAPCPMKRNGVIVPAVQGPGVGVGGPGYHAATPPNAVPAGRFQPGVHEEKAEDTDELKVSTRVLKNTV